MVDTGSVCTKVKKKCKQANLKVFSQTIATSGWVPAQEIQSTCSISRRQEIIPNYTISFAKRHSDTHSKEQF